MDKKIYFPKKIINNYIKTLRTDIEISDVLLFGSFAYGKPTKHSDVDLVIISPNFRKKIGETELHGSIINVGASPHPLLWTLSAIRQMNSPI